MNAAVARNGSMLFRSATNSVQSRFQTSTPISVVLTRIFMILSITTDIVRFLRDFALSICDGGEFLRQNFHVLAVQLEHYPAIEFVDRCDGETNVVQGIGPEYIELQR